MATESLDESVEPSEELSSDLRRIQQVIADFERLRNEGASVYSARFYTHDRMKQIMGEKFFPSGPVTDAIQQYSESVGFGFLEEAERFLLLAEQGGSSILTQELCVLNAELHIKYADRENIDTDELVQRLHALKHQ